MHPEMELWEPQFQQVVTIAGLLYSTCGKSLWKGDTMWVPDSRIQVEWFAWEEDFLSSPVKNVGNYCANVPLNNVMTRNAKHVHILYSDLYVCWRKLEEDKYTSSWGLEKNRQSESLTSIILNWRTNPPDLVLGMVITASGFWVLLTKSHCLKI